MKFVYSYRTSDNAVHGGEIRAANRELAYQALKEKGIRPSRLLEAPGFFNKLFGKGKRWLAIGALTIVVVVVSCLYFSDVHSRLDSGPNRIFSSPRHQIYGDPALLEEWERTDFSAVFEDKGERLLARYAQPGRETAQKFIPREVDDLVRKTLAHEIVVLPSDVREVVELKQIVRGMKEELRRYLANGVGTPARYAQRLVERQNEEAKIRERVLNELAETDDQALWMKRNEELRSLGLRTVRKKSELQK